MSSLCESAIGRSESDAIFSEMAKNEYLKIYPVLVKSSQEVKDLIVWTRSVKSGIIWFRQKHDYVLIWQEKPIKQMMLYLGSLNQSTRFAQQVLRLLRAEDYAYKECFEGEISCKCGLLIKSLLLSRLTSLDGIQDIFTSTL
jgi:hypothetical protein